MGEVYRALDTRLHRTVAIKILPPRHWFAEWRRLQLRDFYVALLDKGMKPEMARLTLARKIAAIALAFGKRRNVSTPNN